MQRLKSLHVNMLSPKFGGSTGGGLRIAKIEEKYAITWTSNKKQNFEMPIIETKRMKVGKSFLFLSQKEQCLALGT